MIECCPIRPVGFWKILNPPLPALPNCLWLSIFCCFCFPGWCFEQLFPPPFDSCLLVIWSNKLDRKATGGSHRRPCVSGDCFINIYHLSENTALLQKNKQIHVTRKKLNASNKLHIQSQQQEDTVVFSLPVVILPELLQHQCPELQWSNNK